MTNSLHIITLNIPFPADYGGIIDSFYRLKDLFELGIKIHLHTFVYNRQKTSELEKYCANVFYYKRDASVFKHISTTPYIVNSRGNKQLLNNLLLNNDPILFDGLHVSYFLDHPLLKERKKIVRAHNIEHAYYINLTKSEPNLIKKAYFACESLRLKRFERILKYANAIASVSTTDNDYFNHKYGTSVFIPSSHQYSEVVSKKGKGDFILYHGDLSVNENEKIVLSIIRDIAPRVSLPFIIAGKNPTAKLIMHAEKKTNIKLIANPSAEIMEQLIQNAHIHLLPALKPCGLKLKLLYALYAGRFCVVNKEMVSGTNLETLCELANSVDTFIEKLNYLAQEGFTQTMIDERKVLLNMYYNPKRNALLFAELLGLNNPRKEL